MVEALLQAEFIGLVIPPGQLKSLRSRYGSAGNKDDRYDAYVLADVVRTDRHRLIPLTRSTPATLTLRSSVRARRDLVEHRVGLANQLRAHLQIVFPAAVTLFAAIDSSISLAFLDRFPTQANADWLSPKRLKAWLSPVGYSGRVAPAVLHQRILDAPRGATGPDTDTHATVTLAFTATLRALSTQIAALEASIASQLDVHPDAHIVTSLPRAGTLRAARLLAEIGDARGSCRADAERCRRPSVLQEYLLQKLIDDSASQTVDEVPNALPNQTGGSVTCAEKGRRFRPYSAAICGLVRRNGEGVP